MEKVEELPICRWMVRLYCWETAGRVLLGSKAWMPALAKHRGDCAMAKAMVQPEAGKVENPWSSVEDGRATVPPALVTLGWMAKGGFWKSRLPVPVVSLKFEIP